MDIEQLQAFDRIVREGSFSRAARSLDLTQPTISARVQALEISVGGPLFVRGGRQVMLTERGESFLPYARRVLILLAEGIEVAQLTQEGKRGRVTIGTIESLASGFLSSALVRFHKSHPEVEVFVQTGHSDQVEQMLYDGVAKLGLITWPFMNPELTTLLHICEPLVFVTAPEHPLAQTHQITAEDIHLYAKPLLIIQFGVALSETLAKISPHPERTMVVPFHTARELLLQGIGASFLTRSLVDEDLQMGRLVELHISDLPPVYRESALVRLTRTQILSASTQAFVQLLELQDPHKNTYLLTPSRKLS